MSPSWQGSSLRERARAVREGELDARTSVESALGRLQAVARLGAVTELLEDDALELAAGIDARRERGAVLGRLAGVPFAVKANIATRSGCTDCSSRMLRGFRSPFDASAVARLLHEDAVLVAKTNCDEFGMGSSTEHSAWGPTLHPEDTGRVPGGSSGGSAVAVSARGGGLPLALGSDTGGSLRQPASFCGVVGLKPTYGRVSRWGLVAFASSMDQVGPLTSSVRDAALALEIIAGPDGQDARCLPGRPGDLLGACERGVGGLRVGIVRALLDLDEVTPRARELVHLGAAMLKESGAVVGELALTELRDAIAIYAITANAEASSNLARFDGVRFGRRSEASDSLDSLYERSRGEGLGTEVKRRILLGTFVLSADSRARYYESAAAARRALTSAMDEALATHDVLLAPTSPDAAFELGERTARPLDMYRSDVCTLPASLGGHPALSLPGPRRSESALPLGLQLIARRSDEATLLAAAALLEDRGFHA